MIDRDYWNAVALAQGKIGEDTKIDWKRAVEKAEQLLVELGYQNDMVKSKSMVPVYVRRFFHAGLKG